MDTDHRLLPDSMRELRTVGWELLVPFTKQQQGLPPHDVWTSVTEIPRPSRAPDGAKAADDADARLLSKPDLIQAAEPKRSLLHEAAFLNSRAWSFMEGLKTVAEMRAQLVREVQLPPKSMAIKMFFYRVRDDEEVHFPLWDWTKIKVGDVADLDASGLEDQCVKLKATEKCMAAREHFYTVEVTPSNLSLFSCRANDCGLKDGDLLILVGMHIASKQTPEWLWATFWWRGPDQEKYSGTYWTCQDAQRPPSIAAAGVWKNYSMDTTASFQLLKPRPDAKEALCGYPPTLGDKLHVDPADQAYLATYNPFFEATFKRGLKSNCVNCHARASTTREQTAIVPAFEDVQSPSFRDLEGDIRLDYLWSLSRRLGGTYWPKIG